MVGMADNIPDHSDFTLYLQAVADLLPPLKSIETELLRLGIASGNFASYFPDEGPLRRELYPKQLLFFKAGLNYYERLFMKGNRVGGTEAGAYEMTAHMTGNYPPWWEGRRFRGPVDCWLAGDTSATTRDILQRSMLGPWGELGSGMVPLHLLVGSPSRRQGIPEAYESFVVRHASGGLSRAQFKSYDQRRQAYQGTSKHVIWLDEEPDDDGGIYAECVTRTMTVEDLGEKVSGLAYMTFTPLRGLTPFIKDFIEKAVMWAEEGAPPTNAERIWQEVVDSNVV